MQVEDLADAEKVRDWIENKRMLAFGLRPRNAADPTVDILVNPPIDFKVPVAAIADIIAMKTGTGREKDKADIQALKRLGELNDDGARK